ncbi:MULTISPECIES: phosphatidate cytidylyltransferase [Vagococcus]|uniref:phosphatidate cytidylyltransferase n=1 Tax=Vagococcus TaxID=2737 RepID=UPI000E52EEDA|nr:MULTISPECIES: phosphatidate cytidylyltransferase [Vagococcus]RHH69547.1 phosphatidate cytidylyltransferase [Vagococcus sp. AM17-17]
MRQRVITAVVALILFIPLIVIGQMPLQIVMAMLGGIAVYELFRMKGLEIKTPEGILAIIGTILLILPRSTWYEFLPRTVTGNTLFYLIVMALLVLPVFSKNEFTFDNVGFPVLVSLYIGTGFQNFISARETGLHVLMYALFIVWSTDIGAYMVGRKYGQRKLAPDISPNKTIEGSLGGIASAMVVSLVYTMIWPMTYNIFAMLLLTILFSIVGQLGDLVESSYKRYYGVKDSGNILPGHGGILDRFDSLLFVFPFMHLVGLF